MGAARAADNFNVQVTIDVWTNGLLAGFDVKARETGGGNQPKMVVPLGTLLLEFIHEICPFNSSPWLDLKISRWSVGVALGDTKGLGQGWIHRLPQIDF